MGEEKLIKKNWSLKDKEEFLKYLMSLENKEKIEWTKNLLNTKMEVLAIKIPILRKIAKIIMKGNYLSFLDLKINDYYENTIINAIIISNIKDYEIKVKYLNNYVRKIDNWSSVDTLRFDVKNKEREYLNLSKKYLNSNKPFIKRVGIIILFNFLDKKEYLDEIFSSFKNDEDYYVNMAYAWLLCECFIKNREETLSFIQNNELNKFVNNKFISKCKDSFRVTKEDKKMLEKYRIK